jgi:hypothetical protein
MMEGISYVKIDISDETYEIFKATRVFHCLVVDCRFNALNYDKRGARAECVLKRVYIGTDAKCMQFEKVEK